MKEFIEKLIGRLEEYRKENEHEPNSGFIEVCKDIVNQLADGYKDKYVRRETLNQYMWERDTAISQLEELGLGFGQKINGVYLTYDKYNKLLKYKWFLKLKMTIKSWFG